METNPLTVNDDAIADEAFEPTEAELVILNASDREIEAMQAATKLELINLQVAAIAGWENIEIWNPHAIKKSYVGVNLSHPELGIHIPNYVGSIDAIWEVFEYLSLKDFQVAECSGVDGIGGSYEALQCIGSHEILAQYGETPAIALCKLLLAINPEPITVGIAVIDDDGEIESQVLEATFGS